MSDFPENLDAVRRQIAAACRAAGRDPGGVALLAVSKTRPAGDVRAAWAAGQRAFGENYLQEALDKMAALADLPLEWHFIGHIQSNKTRAIAEHFAWAHGVDSLKVARRLGEQRPAGLPPLNICLQVNISGEASKDGFDPAAVAAAVDAIAGLPGLRLRGLMAIPEPAASSEARRLPFRALCGLLASLRQKHPELDTLSMGMSADLAEAIAEGATIVRVGTALFGPRPSHPPQP
jgi:PLP dependent protein